MQVNVPNVGLVNFPDSMGKDEVLSTIKTRLIPQAGDQTTQIRQAFAPAFAKEHQREGFPQHLLGTLNALATASPQQLAREPKNYPEALAYSALGLVNPVNAALVAGSIPMMGLKSGLGLLANAATRTGFMGQGAQALGQSLGVKASGVPQTPQEAGENTIQGLTGAGMALGGLVRPQMVPEIPSIPLVQKVLSRPMVGSPEYLPYMNERLRAKPTFGTVVSAQDPTSVGLPLKTQAQRVGATTSAADKGLTSIKTTVPLTPRNARERPVTIQRADGSTYQALLVGGPTDFMGAQGVAKLTSEGKYTDGVLAPDEKVIEPLKPVDIAQVLHDEIKNRAVPQAQSVVFAAIKNGSITREQGDAITQRIWSVYQNVLNDKDVVKAKQLLDNIKQEVQNVQQQKLQSPTIEGQKGSLKQGTTTETEQSQGQAQTEVPPVGQISGGTRRGNVQGDEGLTPRIKAILSIPEGNRNEQMNEDLARWKKQKGEAGFFRLGGGVDLSSLWFKGQEGTKFDSQQLFNRIKNVLGEGSGAFEYLKNAGLGQFLTGPKTMQEVQKWMEGVQPKVEVRNPEPKFTVFGKDKGQAGSIIHPATIVKESLEKLDSLKSIGSDIVKSVLDSHSWKALYLSRLGYDLPKIEALSPTVANATAQYANAGTASLFRGRANMAKVLGDNSGNEQFRKQLGGIIYEDMRQAEGGIGRNVLDLKNSPFRDAAQYNAALKNLEMQQALQRWKKFIQEPAQEMHLKLGGSLAQTGEATGTFGNLIAVLEDEPKFEGTPVPGKGPLATMKKGSAFSKERKFSGQEYNLDAYDMGLRMMTRNAAEYRKRLLYDELESSGLGKLLKTQGEVPEGMVAFKNPVTLRSIVVKNPDGTTDVTGVNRWIAVDKRIAPEIRQAFQLDTNWKEWLKENHPLANHASQVIIKTQVGLGIDLGFHTFNDIFAVANSPKGWLGLPEKVQEVAKSRSDLIANEPKVQEELAKMAEAGITFRGESLGGWSSHALKVADNITRLVLNREYDSLVEAKKVVDSPAERRRYINGRAGQYNKRFMTWFQQGMQETGLGSFNVAGRNFNRLAVGQITFSPGVKATSATEALRLRLTIAAGIATAALIVPAVINQATTGEMQPQGTQLGDIVVSKNKDGTYKVVNMRKWTMLARGGRATGIGAVMKGQVLPRLHGEEPQGIGQTLGAAASDIGRTALAPYSGPPLNVASTLLSGKTELGLGYEQRTPGEKGPPYIGAALGTLNPLVGPLVGSPGTQSPTAVGRIGQRIASVAGVQNSQQPLSVLRQAALAYKKRNNIYTDEASFAPSEYSPLKSALLNGDIDQAKAVYQQLIHEKAQEHPSLSDEEAASEAKLTVQKEFSRLENFRFVNKENEDHFKASLNPQQRKLYDTAVAQQKQIAETFFSQIQPKVQKKGQPFRIRGPRHFSRF